MARGFTSYLLTGDLVCNRTPLSDNRRPRDSVSILAFLLVSVMTFVNVRGMEQTKRFQFVVVALSMTTIVFVIIVGSTEIDVNNYTPFIPPEFGWQGVVSAASVVFWHLLGLIRWRL